MKVVLTAIILVLLSAPSARAIGMSHIDFDSWMAQQTEQSVHKMMANISPSGAAPGVVVASPQPSGPNYLYHWVRDASLTMDVVVSLFARTSDILEKNYYRDRLVEFARFSRRNQMTSTRGGMGEPKFNIDGSAFNDDWCRPQNDGPALRAMTLIHFARLLLDQNPGDSLVRQELYDGRIPTSSVIKADLEFVSHHWRESSCDIWEEVEGDHFYTRLVQRRALIEGAALAKRLGDDAAASWYISQASLLESEIFKFWDGSKGVFVPTLNWKKGIGYKSSGLDSQVVLGILHSEAFDFSDDHVQNTVSIISNQFQNQYPINHSGEGVGIGRYPEDVYDGARFQGGNPWVLITASFATIHYRAATEWKARGDLNRYRTEVEAGDRYMKRIQAHANPDGSLAEQFDRQSGYMTSARDLTWSYSEFIRASWARRAALGL